jgi:two-component system, chemotaxis family, sensor kinase CheA
MNDRIFAQVESLAESLVLWDGRDPSALKEAFAALAGLAEEAGQGILSQACRAACRRLAGTDGSGTAVSGDADLVRFLEELVSALQDVVVNGRDPSAHPALSGAVQPASGESWAMAPAGASDASAETPAAASTPSAPSSPSWFVDKKILADFLARQDGVMEEFESLILDWERSKDTERMREILRLMHTVKGESALLGISDVEHLCHAVEDYLGRAGDGAKIDLLLETKDWFLQVFRFHSGRAVAPAPMESVREKLMAPVDAGPDAVGDGLTLDAWITLPAGADQEILADFICESREHLENADLKIMSLETDPGNQEAMNAIFRAFHSIKGVAAFLGLEGIRTLAHEVETLLDKVRSGTIKASGGMVDLWLESVDAMRKILSALAAASDHQVTAQDAAAWNALLVQVRKAVAGNLPEAHKPAGTGSAPALKLGEILVQAGAVTSEELRSTLSAQENGAHPGRLGEILVKEGKASAQAVTQALRTQKSPEESPAAAVGAMAVKETVKVEAERLDRLLDAIGELVIAESMIVQSPELRGKVSPTMLQRLAHLDKITRGLQEMGTSLRMVPIRPVFQKMARLVRDLSKKQGKAIEFATHGDQTELDKTVVEKIGDPLVHMVRNAIDHGIETDSQVRIRSGKPAVATVQLSAFQKGGNICIKLQDDGRGLNREAILAKARENGLIKPDAVLEDRDVWQLIFEPGFSTAKEVTETSGRGVGMDVVKRNVEELRGRIEIQSHPGVGTTFSIWLPLTLAIIDGMIVRLGGDRFIFPTLSILRIVPLVEEEIYSVVGKGEMLKLQDEMIPLIRLHQLYPGFESAGWARLAVIVESEGKKVGIPVNELLGQQQIVIKALGESFKNIPGLTGGAILSDGNVGMILDVDGLMKCLLTEDARA